MIDQLTQTLKPHIPGPGVPGPGAPFSGSPRPFFRIRPIIKPGANGPLIPENGIKTKRSTRGQVAILVSKPCPGCDRSRVFWYHFSLNNQVSAAILVNAPSRVGQGDAGFAIFFFSNNSNQLKNFSQGGQGGQGGIYLIMYARACCFFSILYLFFLKKNLDHLDQVNDGADLDLDGDLDGALTTLTKLKKG
ncbi:MAG: hypothetical protein HOE02_05755 [Candidatus Marinimicrobia bacterium]|jgi:hypothetical protein|nr:hypothetical protein [Candidatus Neomarinimicrobiota bacterium]